MAAPDEVTIKTKIVPDAKGAEDASRGVKKVGSEAEKAGKTAKSGFDQARGAVARFNSAVRAITNISFIAGGIASVVQLWDRLTASARKAKEEAAALAVEQAKATDAKRVSELADAYKKLGDAISAAAKERQRANELEDLKTSEADRLEDEESKLEKARQIAALDPNDPAYAEKKQRIENAFEVSSAKRGVERARRDAETKERREYAEAEAKHGAAAEKEFSLFEDRAELDRLRGRANEARAKSVQENEFDVKTFGESFVNNLKSILSLDGEHFWSDRTAKGDEERKRQEEEAKRYDAQAKEMEARIKAKEAEIAALTEEASHHSKRAGVFGISAANTTVAAESAKIQGKTSTAAADKALADSEARRASALAAVPQLSAERDRIKAQIAAEEERKAAAGMAVYQAQGAYDAARIGGSRGEQQSTLSGLQAAQNAAQNVNHAADSAISALTETLKGIEERLKAAQNFLKNQSKQQNYAWSESPSGQ